MMCLEQYLATREAPHTATQTIAVAHQISMNITAQELAQLTIFIPAPTAAQGEYAVQCRLTPAQTQMAG